MSVCWPTDCSNYNPRHPPRGFRNSRRLVTDSKLIQAAERELVDPKHLIPQGVYERGYRHRGGTSSVGVSGSVKMSSCLYECLYEADLEKYYPSFVAVGLQRTEQLAEITMKDYPKLGVHNMDDRKRLFQLIKIVQSVQEEEDDVGDAETSAHYEPGCVYLQPQSPRTGPCRQLKFDSFFVTSEGLRNYEMYTHEHKAETSADILPEDSQMGAKASRENGASTCPQTRGVSKETSTDISTLLGENEAPVIQRVTHVSGYNYGVPQSCMRANNFENEGPWAGSDKIRVCVRKRPLGAREARRGEVNVVTVEDKETVLIHEKKEAVDLKQYILEHVFYFDEVFSEALTNQDVYMRTAHPLIQHVFNGGHASCFAYGQTGAGKTYTMIGTPQNPGLYGLAAKDIFRQLETSQPKRNLFVWISFYEIYCGQLYDLLNGRKRLFAREDGNHVVQIVGLREVQVESVDLLLEVIHKGSRERSTGATGVNSDSSRSHAIIQIQVKDSARRLFGRMSFIDLAGSERAADARESNKQTKFEGAEINQSLLALKECIRALDQEHAHTPFRQSKLTQVLKDSFIGNSKTCMIANISPSHVATEHTLNTLRYADRVKELKKGIKCCAAVTNRSRTVGNSSPKRVQNQSFVHQGEKASPKKVKLVMQHSPNPSLGPSKLRAYPSVFHPMNVPLSSTPKTVKKGSPVKGNSNQPWLHRTTPIKGFLKSGKLSKKRTDDLVWHADKRKGIAVGITASVARECDPGHQFSEHESSPRTQKVQAVRPVIKQIVPKNNFPYGDRHHCLSDCSATINTNHLPLQKEKEQHLRIYHKQFQQPPILQQKLKYQPLEKFLATYRPQEIHIQDNNGVLHQRSMLSEAVTQPEDLDDSDFSEDSFSYNSNQNKKKKRGKIDHNCRSFYLHNNDLGTIADQKLVTGEPLYPLYGAEQTQDQKQSDRWCFTNEPLSPKNKVIEQDSARNQCDRCAENDFSTSPFPQNNNTPEKPYSYEEDLACKWKNHKDFPSGFKYSINNKWQVDSDVSLSLGETYNSSLAGVLESNVTETTERKNDGPSFMEDPSEDQQGSREENRQKEKENDPCKMANMSNGSISGLMDPLSVSLLESERNTTWDDVPFHQSQETYVLLDQDPRTFSGDSTADSKLSLEGSKALLSSGTMSAVIKQMLKYDKISKLQAALEFENERTTQTLDRSKSFCSFEDFSPSSTHPASAIDKYLEAPNTRSCLSMRDGEDVFLNTKHELKESSNSRQYDADTEETIHRLNSTEKSPNFDSKDKQPNKEPQETSISVVSLGSSIDERVHNSNGSPSSPPSSHQDKENKFCDQHREKMLPDQLWSCCKEIQSLQHTFKFSLQSEESGIVSNKIVPTMFVQDNLIATEHDSGCLDNKVSCSMMQNSPKKLTSTSSQTSVCEMLSHNEKTLGKAQQIVVQAHQEHLDEMISLGIKEECLLRQVSQLGFKEYVTKVDEIMLLKSKCLQSMRSQLQLYLAYLSPSVEEERTASS
ncbi:kinesin-like protein KIF24 isoform X1 [Pleurodeles waltl]